MTKIENNKLDINKIFNTSFCIKPFTEYANSAGGQQMLCCRSETIDNHDNNDVVDIFFNHTRIKQIREEMLQGKSIPECKWCVQQETYRNTSGRTEYTSRFYNRFPELTQHIFTTGQPVLKTFDIKFGNICNQACVMCNSSNSSLIAKEQNHPIIDHNVKNLEKLKTVCKDIIRFKTTGGEPTLQPGFEHAIDLFIETDTAKNIDFVTVTNGTTNISKYVHKMSKFDHFTVNFSLDAISESVYSYVRYPGNIKKVKSNHQKLIDAVVQNNYDNIGLSFSCVVHALNITDIHNVIKYVDSLDNSNFEISFQLEPVIDPKELHASIVDKETLHKAIKDAQDAINESSLEPEDIETTLEVLEYLSNYKVEQREFLLNKLLAKVKYWKQVRNLDGYEIIPHLNLIK